MVELKARQQQEMEGKLPAHSMPDFDRHVKALSHV